MHGRLIRMKHHYDLAFLAVGAALLVGVAFITLHPATKAKGAPRSSPAPVSQTISERRAGFVSDIQTLGAGKAYAKFSNDFAPAQYDVSHNAAHLFGEELFTAGGLKNVVVCDSAFNFGCYHGFFLSAVAGSGLDVVASLDAACSTQDSGRAAACQHGIGHGILEFLGPTHLVEALTACGKTNQPDPLAGCTSGVFMEYNVPLVTTEEGTFTTAPRPLDPKKPYAPCDTLPTKNFQMSCYQELAQWWKHGFDNDFSKMSALCTAVTDPANRDACYAGIAKMGPSSANYDVAATEKICATLPSGAYDLCLMRSAWAFESNNNLHADALALCAYASPAVQAQCPK